MFGGLISLASTVSLSFEGTVTGIGDTDAFAFRDLCVTNFVSFFCWVSFSASLLHDSLRKIA